MAKTAREEMAEELEQFETDLHASADDEFTAGSDSLEETHDREDSDTGEEEKKLVEDESSGEEDEKKVADQGKAEEDEKFVTLPDDAEAFGDRAGKRITYAELQEANLVDKLVTWGHQGRHMVQRGQEELEETKKMRALLEEQLGIIKEDKKVVDQGPQLTPEQAADQIVNHYSADFKVLGDSGAIEPSFFDTYPKIAAQIEHRFRAARDLGEAIIRTITDMKKSQDDRVEVDTTTASRDHLRDVMVETAGSNELFGQLDNEGVRKEFMSWATREGSTLNWVDKDASLVTPDDISASWLLYLHEHPDKFASKKREVKDEKEEERRLAGGGGHGTNTESRSTEQLDEMQQFEKDLKESRTRVEY